MLTVHEARRILLDVVAPLEPAEVDLVHALGHTLAETVVADRDAPPTDRSAMDGFAVRSADLSAPGRTLSVQGEIRAGQTAVGVALAPGSAIRIFTGAVIPAGADAVIMVELTEEDVAAGTVRIEEQPQPGQHIRRQGEDRRAGETVVLAGTVLRPAEIAALAAVGCARVAAVRAPRVAVISTGDEVVAVDAPVAPHQVRNSNAHALAAQLATLGVAARYLGIAGDSAPLLDSMIREGLKQDVLVLTGGVSAGAYDLVGAAITRAGCEVLFHHVAMRPGKPILVARCGATLVLGLAGNPVSAFTGFHVFVAPAIRRLMGDPIPVRPAIRATLSAALTRRPGRRTYALGLLEWRDGRPVVTPVSSTSSGDVLALPRANAFIVAEGDPHALPAGNEVDVEPWRG
jgi:molybdopterin molybdotransferase